jgi:ATP-dependent RNA helicase DeaD
MHVDSLMDETPIGFAGLGLSETLLKTLAGLGYEEPTPIQREAIPPLLAGRDLLGQAATGTGKTAAFALPLLQRIAESPQSSGIRVPRALVLVPTRELAMQVAEAMHKYGHPAFGTSTVPIYGGQAIQQQLRALSRGVDVVVATPGRAIDHIQRGSMKLSSVQFVVLDEADEMLDMGFADDLEAILKAAPEQRQTALLSATLPPKIAAIAERHLNDPVRIVIKKRKLEEGESPAVRQTAYIVARSQKLAALQRVLDMEDPASTIVFCRTRTEVDSLTETLAAHGYRGQALHGGLSQEERDRVMRRFRDGTSELLVATDVAARGLDIQHVSHVVNFDVPASPDAYVHRIGRTGRAGRAGIAITFAEPREHRMLRNIEQLTRQKIEIATVPTVMDLRTRKLEMLRATIQENILAGGLDEFRAVVEALGAEHDLFDIAAAAVKMAQEREGAAPTEEIVAPAVATPRARERERDHKKKVVRREPHSPEGKGGHGRGKSYPAFATRVRIGMGRLMKLRPSDIVGAIANEAGVSSRDIGAISIGDKYSIVEVHKRDVDAIVSALSKTKLRGKKTSVREERS